MFAPNIVENYAPGQLRSTKSYIFKTEDVLGEGATGKVFLGRNKKIGEKVAVKVFNNASFDRPSAVQEREFDVLLKIKHTNIVQLLAIENDQISKQRIIIMELCVCSVLQMLDKPEYIYGFPENEFLLVLGDTSSGMKYLQEQGIVHRDIKPGNIMRRLGPDRKSTYKLADFGAARQLEDDGNFYSLYGTEEYLHPHMFERALLKRPLLQPFTAKVDLWSLGVTIYHIVTGMLPFRPFGGRKNRTTMHKMTAHKATGVISAVQRDSEDGPIEYGTELPKSCKLSFGLQMLIVNILVGLLESNTEKMLSFATFFETIQSIRSMRSFDILCVRSAQLIRVFVTPTSSYADFQEHIARQTSLTSSQQILIYDGVHFHPDSSVLCESYPVTSEEQPILLLPQGFDGCGAPITPSIPAMPEIKSNYSLEADYPLARLCAAVLRSMQMKQYLLLTITSTYNTVTKSVGSIIRNQILQLKIHLADVNARQQSVEYRFQLVQDKLIVMLQLLVSCLGDSNGSDRMEYDAIRLTLEGVQGEITDTKQSFHRLTRRQLEADEKLRSCEDTKELLCWNNNHACQSDYRCRERLDVIREDVDEVMHQYRQDRKCRNLGYNEIQIHKMDKLKLREKTSVAESLLTDHCVYNWRESHSKLMAWFKQIAPIESNIRSIDAQLAELVNEEYPKILEDYESKFAIWETRIHGARERLSRLLSTHREQSPSRVRYPTTTPSGGGLRARGVGTLRTDCEGAPCANQSIIYHPPNSATSSLDIPLSPGPTSPPSRANHDNRNTKAPPASPGSSSRMSGDHANCNTNGATFIPVTRAFKKEVETLCKDKGAANGSAQEIIEHSKCLLQDSDELSLNQTMVTDLSDLSLGILDPPDSNFVNHFQD